MGRNRAKGTGGPPMKCENPNPNKQTQPDEPNSRDCTPLRLVFFSMCQVGHRYNLTAQCHLLDKG